MLSSLRPPKARFEGGTSYFWNLDTNKGNIKVKLMPDTAPMHVSSTIYLTRLGFYDDVVFHRVIQGFMAQGGDPTGTGRGGPGHCPVDVQPASPPDRRRSWPCR